jgi:excisionase family DNA binding protein
VIARKRGRPQKSEYLTTSQAAEYLAEHGYDISQRTIARACDRGDISCLVTPGGYRRILVTALKDYLRTVMDTADKDI